MFSGVKGEERTETGKKKSWVAKRKERERKRVKAEKVRKETKRKELSEAQTLGKVSFLVPEPSTHLFVLFF